MVLDSKKILLLLPLLALVLTVSPPSPFCRVSPLPSTIPLSVGETARFDLEEIFDGFNLEFQGVNKDHISVTPKYSLNETKFNSSMEFTSAKIKGHGRFLGVISRNEFSQLVIGTSNPDAGVTIEKVIQIEDVPHMQCYDVEEIYNRVANKTYAIVDCGVYNMGRLESNMFLYVDLDNYKKYIGQKETDVFVNYHHLTKRRIQIMEDPFNHIEYMLRFYTADGVDIAHQDKTYVEIFILGQTHVDFRLFDVIDYTSFPLHSLSILDYQIHFNYVYLLIKDHGLVQMELTPDQRIHTRGFMPIKMNTQKFRVSQMGFNDDLHVVMANDNTVYQFQWNVKSQPTLVSKYALISGAEVEQILLDNHLVIVQCRNIIDDQYDRRVWIFSRRTASFTNAYGSFKIDNNQPHIMMYEGTGRSLHLISSYSSYNIRFSLPYLQINPVSSERAGESEDYVVIATSKTHDGKQIQCKQTIHLTYIENTNTSIMKTGLQFRKQIRVDSPEQYEIPLMYEFFGPNITYNVTFENSNDTVKSYIDKQHKANVHLPPNITKQSIIYFQMYTQESRVQLDDKETVYGIVQTHDGDNYPLHQIKCTINVQDEDLQHTLACLVLTVTNLPYGKIIRSSQLFSPHERFIALVFEKEQRTVYLYYLYSFGLTFYGQKNFDYTYANSMTGVEITNNRQLIITFQYSKKIQVYKLQDLHYSKQYAKPIFTIDHQIMRFFGVEYFAPVDVKVSIHHDQVAFVKTKTGVMAININNDGFPNLLFTITTPNSLYDFEVGQDTLVVVTAQATSLYRLTRPLSRTEPPYLKNKLSGDFSLNEYSEINSEGFFYLVEHSQERVLVIHADMPSTSVIYTEIDYGKVLMMDAVRLTDRQIVFGYTGNDIVAWVLAQNPKIHVEWPPYQKNFTLNINGYNQKSTSEQYATNFTVIQSDEATIKPTAKFNASKVLALGHLDFDRNEAKVNKKITIPDMDWFTGNVMHYNISCKDCHKNESAQGPHIHLQSHVQERRQVVFVGEPVYDLESSWNGIYGQMFNGFFKTFAHNDSVQFIVPLPTSMVGEVCTKIAIGKGHDYALSFCESGEKVYIYLTSFMSFKPHTMGPFETDAKAVNHVKIVDNILMIVDNDDDPFRRAGGVYLYYIDFGAESVLETVSFLDYLDYEDLQIEGFVGLPYIASADLIRPHFATQEYVIFLTEARTGNIFAFNFHVSSNKQEAVYLQRKMVNLQKLIPDSALHPDPLRVININIIDYTIMSQSGSTKIQFIFLLTVRNWHHMEIMVTFDREYDLNAFQLVRLYERVPYPWTLVNYMKIKKGSLDASYFGLSYRNYEVDTQIIAIYELPRFKLNQDKTEELMNGIPITRSIGGHKVMDTSQVCYDFHVMDDHRMLFNDVGASNITQIQFNKNLTIFINNITPSEQQAENITLIARNYYFNFTYDVELSFDEDKLDERTQIVWVLILIIGFLMIIGLIIVWSRQKKSEGHENIKESLLTVDPQFKNNYINRSSADPASIRGTITQEPKPTMHKEQAEDQDNERDPLDENVENKEQTKA